MPRARIPPPWKADPKLASRRARLARLRRKGLTLPGDKASLRIAADQAARSHIIRKV